MELLAAYSGTVFVLSFISALVVSSNHPARATTPWQWFTSVLTDTGNTGYTIECKNTIFHQLSRSRIGESQALNTHHRETFRRTANKGAMPKQLLRLNSFFLLFLFPVLLFRSGRQLAVYSWLDYPWREKEIFVLLLGHAGLATGVQGLFFSHVLIVNDLNSFVTIAQSNRFKAGVVEAVGFMPHTKLIHTY